nr:hypothetical protein Q903MT_gene1694 [Picea sitchensis]
MLLLEDREPVAAVDSLLMSSFFPSHIFCPFVFRTALDAMS